MEWVETTAATVEEAKSAALDELGVDEHDAEFEVLEEPRTGLFGRVRGEARVRARVRPTKPRAKEDRRDRKRRTRTKADAATGAVDAADGGDTGDAPDDDEADAPAMVPQAVTDDDDRDEPDAVPTLDHEETETMQDDELSLEEQGDIARTFVAGLMERFGLTTEVTVTTVEDDLEVAVTGRDLGLLIGPRGTTLQAVQELARTAVQRRSEARTARLHVDVAGYRQKRKEALERFTRQVADEVKASGEQRVLEPMSPADRKIVHDTANTIDGVQTSSEGEEPRRRVVIAPA